MLSWASHRISSCLRWARAFWGTAVSRLTSNLRCRNEASPCSDSGSSWSISLRSKRLCLFWDGDLFVSLKDRIKPLWTLSYFELHLHKATHKCRSLSTLMKLRRGLLKFSTHSFLAPKTIRCDARPQIHVNWLGESSAVFVNLWPNASSDRFGSKRRSIERFKGYRMMCLVI